MTAQDQAECGLAEQEKKRESLDTLLKQSVELVDLACDREVDGVAGKVDNETTLNGRVHLLHNLERLAIALSGDLRTLECRLDARDGRLVQSGSRGNGNLDLTTVCAHEVLETLNHLFGLAQSAVLSEHGEEVAVNIDMKAKTVSCVFLLGRCTTLSCEIGFAYSNSLEFRVECKTPTDSRRTMSSPSKSQSIAPHIHTA